MKHLNNKAQHFVLLLLAVFLMGSCTKNFENINTPPEGATDAGTPAVYNAIVSSLPMSSGQYSVMNAWMYPITQQAIITGGSYPYENANGEVWTNYYSALASYRLLQSRISATTDSTTMNNLSAMLRTIMAYETFRTTNYFGDMPYFLAGYAPLNGSVGYKVPFDKQSDIYASILSDLQWAVNNFSDNADQYSVGAYETFLQNNIPLWTKFANSLRLYVAVTMYDKDNATAAAQISDALTKPLLADGEDIGLWPANIPGLQFQWRNWSFSANCYLRMGSTMWNLMSANNNTNGSGIFDPRCQLFYETNNAGQWAAYDQNPTSSTPSEGGAPYNADNRTADWTDKGAGCIYSPVNVYYELDQTTIPELMLTAAQVHLLKAEVYNRGLGATADAANAATEYNAGITASVNMWTGIAFNSPVWVVNKPAAATATPAQINTLLTNPSVAYNSGSQSAALSQIYAQLWIDQYRQPWDAWTLMKRTGGKTPMDAGNTGYYASNFGDLNRFVYPDAEVSYNYDNWKAATGGSDLSSSKMWINP